MLSLQTTVGFEEMMLMSRISFRDGFKGLYRESASKFFISLKIEAAKTKKLKKKELGRKMFGGDGDLKDVPEVG